ncbi:hypothetical protein AW736_11435 [Termitidicoccus mucosus]|uniref:Uncharacterized protein n=1 Tax=Termitidicoccus mucosus TaxID=1184151 RepID=A0A178IJ52_9BACT|nr:hypothetical protein AW736_11435 [Opitutaceae bacterium TSB47]
MFCAAAGFAWAQDAGNPGAAGTGPAPDAAGRDAAGAAGGTARVAAPVPPTADARPVPEERPALDPSALPTIAIDRGLPGGDAAQSRQDGRSPAGAQRAAVERLRAQNWLLDGVRQRETEAELRRRATEAGMFSPGDTTRVMQDWTEAEVQAWLLTGDLPEKRTAADGGRFSATAGAGGSGEANRANGAGTADNPFSSYLANWLTPADHALLNAGAGGTPAFGGGGGAATAGVRDAGAPSFAPGKAAGVFAGMSAAGAPDAAVFDLSAVAAAANNPFVEDIPLPVPAAPAAPGVTNQPPVPDQTPARQDGGNPALRTPEDKAAKPADGNAPMTAPIIDDRKYFPQLNRF